MRFSEYFRASSTRYHRLSLSEGKSYAKSENAGEQPMRPSFGPIFIGIVIVTLSVSLITVSTLYVRLLHQYAPRPLLTCGESIKEAQEAGCTFDRLTKTWLPSVCSRRYEQQFLEYPLTLNITDWKYWTDLSATEQITDDDMAVFAETKSRHDSSWVSSMRMHLSHCAFGLLRRSDMLEVIISTGDSVSGLSKESIDDSGMMWLINAKTYALENITNPQKDSYAILSHTWENGEVSFQQYQNMKEAMKLKGFKKIDKTVQLARQKNLKYAWVDTCCINQSSSAELSEAINSMFKWYLDAAVCFVFLSDLPSAKITPLIALADSIWSRVIGSREVLGEQLVGVHKSIALAFAQCRWFFRGWTLQELIAPEFAEFYDDEWNLVGTKQTLREPLSCVTRIPKSVLLKDVALRKVSNAQRMSWAADRRTTRVEDIAYCLLGLFGINMSPLYGEGQNAFIRLQEEILKQSDDATLFAWETEEIDDQQYQGILASSPDKFRGSGTITQHKVTTNEVGEFRMTNKGLRLNQTTFFN
ncbi:heterokaryon incompatibility protein-domain-containing protein [Xylaria venustula]|nr:heterokaryon incompatibility protein-domain-containing protein [Xylaria venustula]